MTLKTFMITAAASALISSGAIAQDTPTTGTDAATGTDTTMTPEMPAFTSISEMTVGDIIGQNVYEPNGDTIGDIDYIVGRDGGANAVIGIGGFLGLGEYTVALPLEEFTYDADQQMVKLDTTKDALKEQPEFDESDIESLPNETRLGDLMASADTTVPADTTEGTAATYDPATSIMDDTESEATATDDATADTATDDAATDDTGAADETVTEDAQTGEDAMDEEKKDDASN